MIKQKHFITISWIAVMGAMAVLLAGCTGTSKPNAASYLTAPSRVHLEKPVYLMVEDRRPEIERQGDPSGFYLYTVDGANPDQAGQALGVDLCRALESKGMTSRARVGLPGEVPPTGGVVVHLTLLSWYGRVRSFSSITEQTIGAVLAPAAFAEGRCRFRGSLSDSGRILDLGLSEGAATLPASRNATIAREGNLVSAAAADKAMVQWVQAFERAFSK